MDALIFVGFMVAILLLYMTIKLKGKSWKKFFATKEGKGILKGIILAPVVILLIALVMHFIPSAQAQSGSWLNDASVFAGIDRTHKQSPQCDRNDTDNRGTSNLGAKLNIWQSDSKNVRVNSKYTHHSCVLGSDARQYDAIGIELEWRVWQR